MRRSTPHVQQKKITATSSISSTSLPYNNKARHKSKETSDSPPPPPDHYNTNEQQSNYNMIDHIFLQLRQSIEGDVLQQELAYQENKQKIFDETHAQINQYKDYLNHYSTHQMPYLQKYKDRNHSLSDNMIKLTESVDRETVKLSNVKNDLNDLVQFHQQQSDLLKEKVICYELTILFISLKLPNLFSLISWTRKATINLSMKLL